MNKYVSELKKVSQRYAQSRFVCGLKSKQIQKSLLSENNLSYSKVVEIAVEMIERDACESKAKDTRRRNKSVSWSNKETPCYHCGEQHQPTTYRFNEATCRL